MSGQIVFVDGYVRSKKEYLGKISQYILFMIVNTCTYLCYVLHRCASMQIFKYISSPQWIGLKLCSQHIAFCIGWCGPKTYANKRYCMKIRTNHSFKLDSVKPPTQTDNMACIAFLDSGGHKTYSAPTLQVHFSPPIPANYSQLIDLKFHIWCSARQYRYSQFRYT